MKALGDGRRAEYVAENPMRFSRRAFVDVVLCAENYPATPKIGMRIEGLDRLPEGVFAFHGGTKRDAAGNVTGSGGGGIHTVPSGGDHPPRPRARPRAAGGGPIPGQVHSFRHT